MQTPNKSHYLHIVIGADGFIGSHLAHSLISVDEPVLLIVRDKKRIRRLSKECHDSIFTPLELPVQLSAIPSNTEIILYNFATYYEAKNNFDDIENYIETNLIMPMRLFSHLSNFKTCIINAGSFFSIKPSATGKTKKIEFHNDTLYAATKSSMSNLLERIGKEKNFTTVDIILPAIYGFDTRDKIINVMIRKALLNQKCCFKGGTQIWDYLYVEDLVQAFIKIASKFKKKSWIGSSQYLIGSDNPIRVSHLADIINDVFELSLVSFDNTKRDGDINFYFADTAAFQKDFNWVPQWTHRDAIEKIIKLEKQVLEDRDNIA